MPRRRSNVIRNLLLLVFLVVFLLMGVSPLIESFLPINSKTGQWLEWSRSRVMEGMVAAWFFAFGSMVGSFINVVVWRMPRGVSVVSSGSACPWCTNKIQLKDNIPIFGWLKLGGRCRVCRLPISPRYPIVEAIFGFVFLLLFFVELQSACGNLPGGKRYVSTGILQVILSTKWDVILTYVFHMLLVVMLLIWSLMAYDKSRLPVKTIVFALLIGFGVSVGFPYVHPVIWNPGNQWFAELPWIERLATGFIGLACGFFLGSILEVLLTESKGGKDTMRATSEGRGYPLTTSLMTIGLFLGWQASMWIVFFFGLLLFVFVVTKQMRLFSVSLPANGVLTLAALVFLCTWVFIQPEQDQSSIVKNLLAALPGIALVWIANGLWRTDEIKSETT